MACGLECGAIADGQEDLGGVLMPIPGMLIKTPAREKSSSIASTSPATVARCSFSSLTCPATLGITNSTAAVAGTTTVCSLSAVKIRSTSTSGSAGWICVSRDRIRFSARVVSWARSSAFRIANPGR